MRWGTPMVRSSLPTVMLGYDSTPSEVFLDWRNRFVRVTGTGWSGKTDLMADIVSKMDAAEVDILVYAREDDDEDALDPRDLFPGARVEEGVDSFRVALDEMVVPRLAGCTDRPLLLVAPHVRSAEEAAEDVMRVARHAEKLNAYVLTEDNFGRTLDTLVESFEDVRYTKLSSKRPEAVLRYSKEQEGALFRPSVFEGVRVDE